MSDEDSTDHDESDEPSDPFSDFEDVEDRDGDPFETLAADDDDPPESLPEDLPVASDDASHTDPLGDDPFPFEQTDEPRSSAETDDPQRTEPESSTTAPFDDVTGADHSEDDSGDENETLLDEIGDEDDPFRTMHSREGDPFAEGESVFEEVDVGDVNTDQIWDEITSDPDTRPPESRYAEVSKHRYCEQCEYFSSPPEVSCSNEGTEIMEFLDMETVRLYDCPVVAEQREIERKE